MRTMNSKLAFPLVAVLALGAAACDDGSETTATGGESTLEVTQAALSAGEAEGDGQALGLLAFPRPRGMMGGPGALTAEERVQRLKDFVAERLTCATASEAAAGDGVTIVFERECQWAGRVWTGTVTFTWTAGGDTADIVFSGVKANGATLTGDMTVTRVEEDHVTVEADWTRTRPDGKSLVGSWNGDYSWTESTYTIHSATHVVTVDGASATRTSTDLVWQKNERAPESGTVTFSGFGGKTWSMVYGRDESGALQVTVTGPNGQSRTFTIGADGEPGEGPRSPPPAS